jgi:hypothetical protein
MRPLAAMGGRDAWLVIDAISQALVICTWALPVPELEEALTILSLFVGWKRTPFLIALMPHPKQPGVKLERAPSF